MNLKSLIFISLICGLTLAQDQVIDKEGMPDTQSPSIPAMLMVMKEVGAMSARLAAMETKLKESEEKIRQLETKGKRNKPRKECCGNTFTKSTYTLFFFI